MKKYKTGGWFKESQRHRLARLGVKTGRKQNYSLETNYAKKGEFYSPTGKIHKIKPYQSLGEYGHKHKFGNKVYTAVSVMYADRFTKPALMTKERAKDLAKSKIEDGWIDEYKIVKYKDKYILYVTGEGDFWRDLQKKQKGTALLVNYGDDKINYARIRGWSKTGKDNWLNVESNKGVSIERNANGYYLVYVDGHKILMSDTYKSALKSARDYMKS